jgi:hypothetical protein
VLENGALYPAAALAIVLPLFLPWPWPVVAGDAVAGEAQAGTLRYLLVRPVGRTKLLVAKLFSVVVYTMLAVVVVAVVAYVVGTNLFGSGPLPSTSGTELSTQQATLRTVLAVLYVGWSMLGVAAVALFLSTSPTRRWRRARRDRAAGDLGGAGRAGGVGVGPAVPADALLAGLRRLLPRPGALPRRRARARRLQAVYIASS